MAKSNPTSVRFSNETKAKLKRYAHPRGWAISRLIEFIVNQWLDFQDKQDKRK